MALLSGVRAAVIGALAATAIAVSGCADDDSSKESSSTLAGGIRTQGSVQSQLQTELQRRDDLAEARQRADLALIERAKPAPRMKPPTGEQLEKAKQVKLPSGAIHYIVPLPKPPVATAATPGCDHGRPQPPGIAARRVGPTRVLVTYVIGEDDDACRAEWLDVVVDVTADSVAGDLTQVRISEKRSGQVVIPLKADLAHADTVIASIKPERFSLGSRSTSIRIR